MWIEDRKQEDIEIVLYEELKNDLVEVALDVLRFIGLEPDSERLGCLAKNENRTFKRSNTETDFLNYFSVSQKFLIAKHVKMLNDTLVKNGHKQLPRSYLDFSKYGNIQFKLNNYT